MFGKFWLKRKRGSEMVLFFYGIRKEESIDTNITNFYALPYSVLLPEIQKINLQRIIILS